MNPGERGMPSIDPEALTAIDPPENRLEPQPREYAVSILFEAICWSVSNFCRLGEQATDAV